MKLSTKDLRTRAKDMLDAVDRGESVVITYRGKPAARVVSPTRKRSAVEPLASFNMWSGRSLDVDQWVDELRTPRTFDAG